MVIALEKALEVVMASLTTRRHVMAKVLDLRRPSLHKLLSLWVFVGVEVVCNLCLVAILLLQGAPEVFELFFGFSVRSLLTASLFMLANALNPELLAAQKGE